MGSESSKTPSATCPSIPEKVVRTGPRASSAQRSPLVHPHPRANSTANTYECDRRHFRIVLDENDDNNFLKPDRRENSILSNKTDEEEDEEDNVIMPSREISFPSKCADFDGRTHFMTRKERQLIVRSWKKTHKTGAEHIGSKIFLRVLEAQPDIKAIFGLEKIPPGRLKYDPRFRQHAVVFTKTFDYLVKNIDHSEKLEHHFDKAIFSSRFARVESSEKCISCALKTLGRRHVARKGRGFDPSYWEVFAECMTQTAIEWEQHRSRPTTCAWRTLVSTIVMIMRRGYDDELAKKKRIASFRI